MLDQLQIHRQILYDLAVHYLEPIVGCTSVWLHRQPARARDRNLFSSSFECRFRRRHVNRAITVCHEELFERLLESPLSMQEEDLLSYLDTLPGGRDAHVQEFFARPGLDSSSGSRLPQEALLLKSERTVRIAAGEEAQGSFRYVTRATTCPTTSASSGVRQDSGMQCDSVCGCIQYRFFLLEPAAPVSSPQFHEIQRPVILAKPFVRLDLCHGRIHQHQAPGPQDRSSGDRIARCIRSGMAHLRMLAVLGKDQSPRATR